MYAISSHWDHFPQGLQALYHDLAQLRRALFEAEDELTPLVLQATRQAGAHMRYKGRLMDATSLGEFFFIQQHQKCTHHSLAAQAIGPYATTYMEEKMGGVQHFVSGVDQEECNDL